MFRKVSNLRHSKSLFDVDSHEAVDLLLVIPQLVQKSGEIQTF